MQRAPGIPHALCFLGREIHQRLGRIAPRGANARLELFWVFENSDPSCPDLIRASINLRSKPFSKKMDHRVKPGDDDLNWYDRHCEERILWFPSRRLLR